MHVRIPGGPDSKNLDHGQQQPGADSLLPAVPSVQLAVLQPERLRDVRSGEVDSSGQDSVHFGVREWD